MTGKRAAHRAEMMARILAEADRQLNDVGAGGLSLREIARALGLASSAIYRYVESRDELLTLLVARGYNELADAISETAGGPGQRLRTIGRSIRQWALDHPVQYALLYGTPVPGFAADAAVTLEPGTRVLLQVAELAASGTPQLDVDPRFGEFAADFPVPLQPAQVAATIHVWSMLLGAISAEVFGYFGPGFDQVSEQSFELTLDNACTVLGL